MARRWLAALRLRSQDLDGEPAHITITVRDTTSTHDRMAVLPNEERWLQRLRTHRERVRRLEEVHRAVPVSPPPALARTYPSAAPSREWQDGFPSRARPGDPRPRVVTRHHLHPGGVRQAITAAVRAAGMTKRATAHTLHAAFAHRLQEASYQLDDIQHRMGHADMRTTQHSREGQAPACKRLHGPLSSRT